MTLDKVREVVQECQRLGFSPEIAKKADDLTSIASLPIGSIGALVSGHVSYMCVEILKMCEEGEEQEEKVMRWLGFVQGLLWLSGLKTLHDLKAANSPSSAEMRIESGQ